VPLLPVDARFRFNGFIPSSGLTGYNLAFLKGLGADGVLEAIGFALDLLNRSSASWIAQRILDFDGLWKKNCVHPGASQSYLAFMLLDSFEDSEVRLGDGTGNAIDPIAVGDGRELVFILSVQCLQYQSLLLIIRQLVTSMRLKMN
jgi:hypothetical protein